MKNGVVLLLLQLVAFWPVWQWYVKRMVAGNEWADVSSWYGSALLGITNGPWGAVTIAEKP